MSHVVIVDSGPLVAYLDRSDSHHPWAAEAMRSITEPIWTCEAALSEAAFLLRRGGISTDLLLALLDRGLLRLPLNLEKEARKVRDLMRRFANVPMSLADACLVRLSEMSDVCEVMTLDSDFQIYRRHGRRLIPLLTPAT